jgi:predicted DNA-binding transcriptional regulator AlpA
VRNFKTVNALGGDGNRRERRGQASKKSDAAAQESRWVTGPTLRRMLDISAVTLWRWRQKNGFPTAKSINGRLYFPCHEIETWLESQPDAA